MIVDYKAVYNCARAFAELKHKDDLRKDNKTPYMVHVNYVDSRAEGITRTIDNLATEENIYAIKCVAVLHDVVEDHPEIMWCDVFGAIAGEQYTLVDGIYVQSIIHGVKAITKKAKGEEEYADYVRRVLNHFWARIVKIADLEHNMSDLKPGSLRDKYSLTYAVLTDATQPYKFK